MTNSENIRWIMLYTGDFCPKYFELLDIISTLKDKDEAEALDIAFCLSFAYKFIKLFDGLMKTLKEFFQYQGIFQTTARELIKELFYDEIVEDGQTWIDMLYDVNRLRSSMPFSSDVFLIINKYVEPLTLMCEYLERKSEKE